ncbi:LysR family transcriptional regulator [Massilia sp. PAMC28688]|uniref:LysR family transcriptional regulator n=1 Tax=Massilia sp. PAMC28688 TaxID=2861283 RepID=UPI001C6251A2|nr:LysR family transcriptional regulator [Massilia sp. PAMC28688]QYF92423.1 LysR family transcriptional regulator [Massilia sp. PAMC28688]
MLKLSLDAVHIIDAIDRRGSFARAALELHRVPSTISYTVAKLEEDLGVQVFERNGPRVTLTAAGRELLREGRVLLRAALELEQRVQRVASGWETELAIGMDSMFSARALGADMQAFYGLARHTRLRVVQETLSGPWEALLERRVDLLVGVAGEGPAGGGYVARSIGEMPFVFAVAPGHELAQAPEPLGRAALQQHRAVVVADSARRMAARTVGLQYGQDALTVPTMQAKFDLQIAGLGFGFLPEPCARRAIDQGLLIEKQVEEARAPEIFYMAWRTGEEGAALKWWRERLLQETLFARLCRHLPQADMPDRQGKN